MGVFKGLMWKVYVARRKRLIQTFIELALPVSMVLSLFILREKMEVKAGGPQKLRPPYPELRFSMADIVPPDGVIYTPGSTAANTLMKEVITILNTFAKAPLESFPINNDSLAVKTLFLKEKQNKTFAVVEFQENVPNKYNLVVRMSEMSPTETVKESIGYRTKSMTTSTSTQPDVLIYRIRLTSIIINYWEPPVKFNRYYLKFREVPKSFLLLQWAIDSSYIKLRANKPAGIQKVMFEPLSEEMEKTKRNKVYASTVVFVMAYISFAAPMLPFVFLMNRLIEERATGIKELVKMVGVTPTMLGVTQFLNVLPICLVFCTVSTILLKATEEPMIQHTNFLVLFIGLFLHFLTMIALAYTCSYMISDVSSTVAMSVFIYIGLWIPISLMGHESKYDILLFFKGFGPHCPIFWILHEILAAEIVDETGVHFYNLHRRFGLYESCAKNGSVLLAFFMQILQIICFFAIAWYLERVFPGKYGIPLRWNFLFKKKYWRKSKPVTTFEKTETTNMPLDPAYHKYFEKPPGSLTVGISIQNISKKFGSGKTLFQALNNVSFNIYKGEITVLLGHNGAGKTTLISIITGMIKQTSGKVYVEGKDTVMQSTEVRQMFGFCPQHNLFCPDLNVLEHLIFFSMIKGSSFKEAKKSAFSILDQLELATHAKDDTSKLSGGMLRRLQLGCALTGNASVLILDEPTSGLDVEARRELWDTLMSLRGNRVLVLTTHFMEEADVLGDRVIALHRGQLRCNATPMFLKKAVGSGFRMQITTLREPNDEKITNVIKSVVPETVLRKKTEKSLEYVVPAGAQISSVFTAIEAQKTNLEIASFGIGVTTLEEVFLELCRDVEDRTQENGPHDSRSGGSETNFQYHSGSKLLSRQIKELFNRQIDFTLSNKFTFIMSHIIMPFALCTSLMKIFCVRVFHTKDDLKMNMDMFLGSSATGVLYSNRNLDTGNIISKIRHDYPEHNFATLEEMPFIDSGNLMFKSGSEGDEKYSLGAAILDNAVAKVFYTPLLRNSASAGLNLLSNILSIKNIPLAHGRTIVTKITNQWEDMYYFPKNKINSSFFSIFSICTLVATIVQDSALPCRERLTVVRHTHIMAGCSPIIYWLVTLSYHMASFLVFCCTAVLVAAAFFDKDRTLDDGATLAAIALVVILSGLNIYIFMYFLSFLFSERITGLILVGLAVVFCFLLPILLTALADLNSTDDNPFSKSMDVLGCLLPPYMFTRSLMEVSEIARFNSYCRNNHHMCPKLSYFTTGFSNEVCCDEGSSAAGPYNYFSFTKYAAGCSMIIITVQIIAFTILVLLFQYGVFNRIGSKAGKEQLPERRYQYPNVIAEKKYVSDSFDKELSSAARPNTLLMDSVWKIYGGKLRGECFGILGQNGAGKTTTFKLISNEESLTYGRIMVNGYTSRNKYLSSLGYCPQFFGLDDFRSGIANIRMLLILRGLSDDDVKKETTSWLYVVGMERSAHRKVAGYSGGMARRVATVAALCGGASLTLLDEPTAGVDTGARRLVWEAMRRGLRNKRAIAICSHSMDEIEMLCNRVMILSLGEIAVIGSPNDLKPALAPGNAIIFKLRVNVVQTDNGKERLNDLKQHLSSVFDCTIKDQHMTSLHYRINQTLPYSEIFTRMESIVEQFSDLIEDYSVSETTLEDVFLAVTTGDVPPIIRVNNDTGISRSSSVRVTNSVNDEG